ncbi:MAG: ArnT family glycosyltransferase [Candidatus Nitrosopumilus sp. bin_7KS]
MQGKQPNLRTNSRIFSFSKYFLILLSIIGISLIIRVYFFPTQIPLTADALYYFWYSSDIYQIGKLPNDWIPNNIGWPIFVSIFFTIFDSKDVFTLMQTQRIVSVLISVLIIIPTYFLCKNFVERKFAIIGAAFVAFDPRIMINSFLGIGDPLYILLITTSLVSFFSSNKKVHYLSFVLVSLSILIRAEGLAFFMVLSIMFLIKHRKEKIDVIKKYLGILGILLAIVLPVSVYQIEINGNDGIFMRNFGSGERLVSNLTNNDSTENSNNNFLNGLELFGKYLIWIMIPNFIIFMPLGLYLIFKDRDFKKLTIILSLGLMSIPALYAYTIPAPDTRYLYVLFPIFSVLAVLSIERIIGKLNKSNFIIVIIISAIIFSSVLFYDYKKIDYDHERESFEIMKEISKNVEGINVLSTESRYLNSIQTMSQWPSPYSEINLYFFIVMDENEDSLRNFISNSKEKGLTHIMTDGKEKRSEILRELFFDEMKYPYLKKIYDSKDNGFEYQVKVFKIDYKLFNSLKNTMIEGKR